jgi:hypothetical protein
MFRQLSNIGDDGSGACPAKFFSDFGQADDKGRPDGYVDFSLPRGSLKDLVATSGSEDSPEKGA